MISHWLFCIQSQWCMLGDSFNMNEEQPIRFIEGQAVFTTSWHARMSLTLDDRKRMFFVQTSDRGDFWA